MQPLGGGELMLGHKDAAAEVTCPRCLANGTAKVEPKAKPKGKGKASKKDKTPKSAPPEPNAKAEA